MFDGFRAIDDPPHRPRRPDAHHRRHSWSERERESILVDARGAELVVFRRWEEFHREALGFMTQDRAPHPGAKPGKATAHNVNLALRHLKQLIEDEDFPSVALPRLATGVGGLDWKTVRPLVDHHLGALDVPIYLYATYHAGQKGSE